MTRKKKVLSAKAIRRLRQVQEVVLAEPRKLNMDCGVVVRGEDGVAFLPGPDGKPAGVADTEVRRWPPCNTVGCIAGTLCVLAGKKPGKFYGPRGVRAVAYDLLGVREDIRSHDVYSRTYKLFFENQWPRPLQKRLARCRPGSAAYARVVCAAIDQWIEGDGGWPA